MGGLLAIFEERFRVFADMREVLYTKLSVTFDRRG